MHPRKNTEKNVLIMSTNADYLQELLNGLLDGVLTDEEQRTLELAMKSDPTLEAKLSELQAMRRSLLRGRSVGRLGSDFSKQVVSAARKRAESMGDQAPEWVLPATRPTADRSPRPSVSPRESRIERTLDTEKGAGSATISTSVSRRAWRVWIPMLAAATAASMAIYFAGPFFSQPSVQPLVGSPVPNQTSKQVDDPLGIETDEQEANRMAVDLLANDTRARVGPDPEVMPGNDSKAEMESSVNTKIAESKAAELAGGSSDNIVSNEIMREKSSDPVQEVLNASGVTNPVYTLVVDIAVDPIAEESGALRTLMEDHEIVYADDLNMNVDQLDSLVASQMIGKMSGIDRGKRSDDVQVIFVRAKAKRIDSFIMEIAGQYKDFPKFRMDMSFDPSVTKLMDQLSTISNEEEGARRLTFRGEGGAGLVSAFPVTSKKNEFLDVDKRKLLVGQSSNRKKVESSRDKTSYLILLVRPAAAN